MQTVQRDKTWAEKIKLAYCYCDHPNTIHSGGIGDCAMHGCTCQLFKEKTRQQPSSFQDVKKVMGEA
jgi:hypothetical protein